MYYDSHQIYATLTTKRLLTALGIPIDPTGKYCMASKWRSDEHFGSCKIRDRGVCDFGGPGFLSWVDLVCICKGLDKDRKEDVAKAYEYMAEIAGIEGTKGTVKKTVTLEDVITVDELKLCGMLPYEYGQKLPDGKTRILKKDREAYYMDQVRMLFEDKEAFFQIVDNCIENRIDRITKTQMMLSPENVGEEVFNAFSGKYYEMLRDLAALRRKMKRKRAA